MNLHQFRFVQEAVRQNLNLTETAKVLFTSQPGISKAILELEDELGGVSIVDPATSPLVERFTDAYWKLRQRRGVTRELAATRMRFRGYFGAMLVRAAERTTG